ncbi:rhodanese-like domain-containing protein [bacterium]|nr:rhodanese-like domain-containing protein [bacterium]
MKKNFSGVFFLLFSVLIVSILPACWQGEKKQIVKKQAGLVVINVLDKALYDDCHIKGSIQIDLEKVSGYALKNIDKKAEIVLYCSNYMCSSSGFARKKLVDLGFENVYVYEGGTAQWYQLEYPIEGPAKSSYLKRKMKAPAHLDSYVLDADELKKKIKLNNL